MEHDTQQFKNGVYDEAISSLKILIDQKDERMLRRIEFEYGPYYGLKKIVENPKISFKDSLKQYNLQHIESLFLNPLNENASNVSVDHIRRGFGFVISGKRKQLNQTKKSDKTKSKELSDYKEKLKATLKKIGIWYDIE